MSPLGAVGSNAGVTREHNRRVVLQALRRHGALSRADLVRMTGLSAQGMSNIAADLVEQGLLMEMGRQRKGRGQPPVVYAIDPAGGFTIGIEIRPAGLAAIAADLTGDMLAMRIIDGAASTPAHLAVQLPALVAEIISESRRPQAGLLGLGIVMPRSIKRSTDSAAPPTELPGWEGVGDPSAVVPGMLAGAADIDLPVILDTDASAAALAEQLYGAARPHSRFACLYFGLGLGLGLVLDGRIQRGAHGFAGEIGHVPFTPSGCGGAGYLEQFLSVDAALKALGLSDPGLLARAPGLAGWLDGAVEPLGFAIAMIETMLDPETIILCGQSDALVDGLLARAGKLPPALTAATKGRLLRGSAGPLSAARGAAALPLYDRLAPEFSARALITS